MGSSSVRCSRGKPQSAVGPASLAIDAGSCTDASGNPVTTDQRSMPRPQPAGGQCDIGAFEFVPASAVPMILSGSRPLVNGTRRAAFAGRVNPDGPAATARFEYGLDSRYRPAGASARIYDHFTPVVHIRAGYAPAAISVSVTGLVPAALYHVRLLVSGGAGTVVGPDQRFITAEDPAPRRPILGRTLNAIPVNGLVRVRIGGTFVPLTEPRQLKSGTKIDARRYSSGLARRGQWATGDRCDGTQTVVRRGTVLLTNLGRHVSVAVAAGRSYLAPARRGA